MKVKINRGLRRTWLSFLTARGFTLIEMLVVMAIIGILAALLLPVLSRARAEGRRAHCISNLGQIGKGLMIYSNSYREYLPCQPAWGHVSTEIRLRGQTLTNYASHQGLSRHLVIGYGGEELDAENDLTPGRLNFLPVGLGMSLARSDLSAELLVCPAMQGTVTTHYGPERYEFTSALGKNLSQSPGKPLLTSDGRRFFHTPTSGGNTVTAVLSSYAYRNTPFYCRTMPDNVDPGWTYVDDQSLANWSDPRDPWLAEWVLEFTRPQVKAEFMCPPFKTFKQLGNRALCADAFDFGPAAAFTANCGLAQYHHRQGYNVLYGDGHVDYYVDENDVILSWNEWADAANPGTDNLTISSPSSHKVWNLFDRYSGIDTE